MHTQDRIRHTLLKETPVEITKVHIEPLSLAGFIIEILSPVGHQKRRQRHLLQTIFRESRGLDKWRPVEYVGRHTILLDTSHRQGDFTRTKMITMDSHSSHSEILRVTVREAAAQYASHRHCRGQFPRDVVGVLILCVDSSYIWNQDVFSYHFPFRGECVSYEERT